MIYEPCADNDLFIDKNGDVWSDNYESQSSVITLEDFLIPRPDLYAKAE